VGGRPNLEKLDKMSIFLINNQIYIYNSYLKEKENGGVTSLSY
jgi:hypothetical protein